MTDPLGRLQESLSDRYRVEHELGAGGMATVYRAHDLRNDRPVALKVLRPELAAVLGAERFLAEIKTTANLQHPHILPLFDSGQADGLVFYVMPFVDGETLRKRLEREHQLGLEETIAIARSVASALDYAHARGVIHRDIKPENILFEGDQPVVADFGIALAVQHAGSARLTETGLSLGTPGYMSPEQATGARVDGRSDIYSLACVVYELLAGEPPHRGATAQAVIAKVVTEKPSPLMSHRDTVPPHVDAAVAKALAKVPADRFANATDFSAALANPGWSPIVGLGPAARRALPGWMMAAGAVVVLLAGLVAGWFARGAGPQPGTSFRGQVFAPPGYQFSIWGSALSPDGRLLAFQAKNRDTARILVKQLDRFEVEPLAGTEGIISNPAFSPDGRWLAFTTESEIRKVPVGGGRAVTLAAMPSWLSSIRWAENDTVYASGVAGGLFAVPGTGGELFPVTVTDTQRGELLHQPPFILRNGFMLFTVETQDGLRIALMAADRRSWSHLSREIAGAVVGHLSTGHLVYESEGLWAVRLDGRGDPLVQPKRLLDHGIGFAVAVDGNAAFQTGRGVRRPVWVDRSGLATATSIPGDGYRWPRVSPGGDRLVMGAPRRLDVIELSTGRTVRINGLEGEAVWSPDGLRLTTWHSTSGSQFLQLHTRRADGSGLPERLLEATGDLNATSWSRDGKSLAVAVVARPGDGFDVAVAGEDKKLRLIASGRGNQRAGRFSPDGRWLAYSSDESGRNEIYLTDYPAAARRFLVSAGGGADPVWSHDGRELFYRTGDRMMAVPNPSQAASPAGMPRLLFTGTYFRDPFGDQSYDVAPDGRFLMLQSEGDSDREIRIITNWLPELERLLP